MLAYHDVIQAGAAPRGDDRLHLPLDAFRRHLDAIERSGVDVVSIAAPMPAPDAPAQLAITFDDACLGCLELAVPELADRGMPATIFVAPGLLGTAAPWWDLLSSPAEGEVPQAIRSRALSRCHGMDDLVKTEAARSSWPRQPVHPSFRIGDEADLATALHRHPTLTVGAHSWSHANLPSLEDEALTRELADVMPWLEARWPGRTVAWIAYPFGLESRIVREAAKRAGFVGALRIDGGRYRAPVADAFATPRFHVSSRITASGFAARAFGLYPLR